MTDEQILQKVDEAMKLGRKQALEEVRAEIAELNNIDYVKPVTVEEILKVIDKHRRDG